MAHILSKIGNRTNVPFRTYQCDEKEDLKDIDVSSAPMGSRCYVINDSVWYILNSKKEWKINKGGNLIYDGGTEENGSSNNSSVSNEEIIYDGGEEV